MFLLRIAPIPKQAQGRVSCPPVGARMATVLSPEYSDPYSTLILGACYSRVVAELISRHCFFVSCTVQALRPAALRLECIIQFLGKAPSLSSLL